MTPLILSSCRQHRPEGGETPRQDFVLLARALGGEFTVPPSARGLPEKLGLDLHQARAAIRPEIGAIVALSEKVGVPLGWQKPSGRLVLVAHHLSSPKKALAQRLTRWLDRFDAIVVLCREQQRYLIAEAGLPAERVHFLHDSVDTRYFTPEPSVLVEPNLVLAVGREQRDYATLGRAMKRLEGCKAVVVADSPWARRVASGESQPGITVRRGISYMELRQLYRQAAVVVVPLEPGVRYAAGVNALLEALSVGKPTVVTRTPGIEDYLTEITEVVPPSDPDALAEAIQRALLAPTDPVKIRAQIEHSGSLETYVGALKALVQP